MGIAIGRLTLAEEDDGDHCDDVDGSEGSQITTRGWARGSFLPIGVS